ncbi:hypothetical protein K505DRAFT_243247 [Melanomma pulvis-pyrius CBS 109.77]|uniref:Cnl2/NKP2 family protein-domain-containing protein n=1 Tax=Melanomma pulvis-pyrius CBS 109.77 TaxID=1314802 RepID=A0A6A6XCC4_9PLEO|nr:hypothetical protein K505DRAFT_243247 [Melanomma pulvis-pyrius CBS 109.77]
MSPQEGSLLKNFLLAPAALRDFMTLQQFTEIFPPAQRSSPAIRDLYVEISTLRQQDIEDVRQNITEEVRRSKQLRREYARERRHRDDANVAGLDLVALQIEEELSGHARRKKPHTQQTIHPAIEEACDSVDAQIAGMEEEIKKALEEVQDAVGELSELRHGQFRQSANGEHIGEEVLATLKRLETACTKPPG